MIPNGGVHCDGEAGKKGVGTATGVGSQELCTFYFIEIAESDLDVRKGFDLSKTSLVTYVLQQGDTTQVWLPRIHPASLHRLPPTGTKYSNT